MARFRVYITPFDDDGIYSDEVEVTSDVVELGSPKLGVDNTDFDVGVVRNSGFNITLRNDHGHYSDVTELLSIFRFTRKNSKVRITWDIRDYDLICGFFKVGEEPLGGEYEIFKGVLNEVSSYSNIGDQRATFAVLGYEALLDEMEVPFSSLAIGNTFSAILLACLNQAPFNELVTVSAANISLGTNLAVDSVASLENKTVGAVLKDILLLANSVLYINEGVVYVTAREATATSQFTFYGQASDNVENILNIPKYRDGMNRVFNYWTWPDVTTRAIDTTSIEDYGVKAKEIGMDLIADGSATKIQAILDANRDEFAYPKTELELETPLWYDTLALQILDLVNIDYPTVFIPYNNGLLPRYGMENYDGTAVYPYEQWSLTINSSDGFKIMSRKIDVKKQTIIFGLREV